MDDIDFIRNNILEDNDASFAPFGYAFQADAGLYLFCNYYKEVKEIKIESALQDIEILDKNGHYILAQAKASQEPFDCESFGSKLFDGLFSLAKHYTSKEDRLIYVTNIPNVLGKEMSEQFNDTIISYSILSKNAKQIINDKIEAIKNKIISMIEKEDLSVERKEKLLLFLDKVVNLNKEKLFFLSITRYYPNSDNRAIKEKISTLLHDDFGIGDLNRISAIVDKLFTVWHDMFYLNSTMKDNKIIRIKKDDFCWPIITISSMSRQVSEVSDLIDEGLDEYTIAEIKRVTRTISCDYSYEIINKILNDFKVFVPTEKNNKTNEFIQNKWNDYVANFATDNDLVTKGATIYFLYCVLMDFGTIAKVIKGKDL